MAGQRRVVTAQEGCPPCMHLVVGSIHLLKRPLHAFADTCIFPFPRFTGWHDGRHMAAPIPMTDAGCPTKRPRHTSHFSPLRLP